MRLPASPYGVTSAAGLMDWLRTLVTSIAAGWSVEHTAEGRHNWTWVDVPFGSGNFSASGSMTWTVDFGDVNQCRYVLLGDLMWFQWWITGSDVGGTADPTLYLRLPSGYRASGRAVGVNNYLDAGATWGTGLCTIETRASTVNLYKSGLANWTLTSSDNTDVFGNLWLRVERTA